MSNRRHHTQQHELSILSTSLRSQRNPSFPALLRNVNEASRSSGLQTQHRQQKTRIGLPKMLDTLGGQFTSEQDVRCATLLSELVYRAAESPDEAAFKTAQVTVEEAVGASLSDVRCHKSGGQRFLVGETEDAIYVAFQGTKSAIDWLANLNFFHGHFGWQHQHHHSSSSSSVSSHSSFSSSSSSTSSSKSGSSRAHIGFLKRANSAAVSIGELHAAAAAAGKRLVLTGHSLGGAVAVLTTVRLLRSLAAEQGQGQGLSGLVDDAPVLPRVRCISFATPAMANSDLLQEVTAAGWDQYITNIVMPEDPVVPFVNLLLKAPASPSQQQLPPKSPSSYFTGLTSPSSSSSSSVSTETPDLSRLNSQESHLSLNSVSWGSNLTFEPSGLAEELSLTLAAAGASAAAALQPLQDQLQAAAGSWLGGREAAAVSAAAAAVADELAGAREALGRSLSFAGAAEGVVGSAVAPALEQTAGSMELASWLAAARGAIKQQAGSQPSQRSFRDSSRCNSNSGNSLSSLTTEVFAQWPASSSEECGSSMVDSPVPLSPASIGQYSFGVPVVASWALDTSSVVMSSDCSSAGGAPSPRDLSSPEPAQWQEESHSLDAAAAASHAAHSAAAAAAGAAAAQAALLRGGSSQPRHNLGVKVAKQLRRLQQQLATSKVGRLAWISGALAAGARCASALAAPAALAGGHVSLLAMLPRALAGPAALAVLHFVGHAAYQAALPASHPLGQQWVMTDAGLEPVAKPLTSYPRTGEGLGLKELGGLFPGHRMIAYRRRLANLVSQSPAPATADAQAAATQPTEP